MIPDYSLPFADPPGPPCQDQPPQPDEPNEQQEEEARAWEPFAFEPDWDAPEPDFFYRPRHLPAGVAE